MLSRLGRRSRMVPDPEAVFLFEMWCTAVCKRRWVAVGGVASWTLIASLIDVVARKRLLCSMIVGARRPAWVSQLGRHSHRPPGHGAGTGDGGGSREPLSSSMSSAFR